MLGQKKDKAMVTGGQGRAEAVDIHCRWRDRGVSTQDIYDARSIKRRVRVSEAMLA